MVPAEATVVPAVHADRNPTRDLRSFPPRSLLGLAADARPASGLVSMATAFTIPALRCPDSNHELERLDSFCPRCGEEAIERHVWRSNRCGSCGKGLGTTRGRHFPVSHCSHCGIVVDV